MGLFVIFVLKVCLVTGVAAASQKEEKSKDAVYLPDEAYGENDSQVHKEKSVDVVDKKYCPKLEGRSEAIYFPDELFYRYSPRLNGGTKLNSDDLNIHPEYYEDPIDVNRRFIVDPPPRKETCDDPCKRPDERGICRKSLDCLA